MEPLGKEGPQYEKRIRRCIDGQVGAISKWEGNKDVGTGEQEITRIVENEVVESNLRFFKPWKSESDAYLKVKEDREGETIGDMGVQWQRTNFPVSIMMLFMNMDKAIGKDFDEGLANLKGKIGSINL